MVSLSSAPTRRRFQIHLSTAIVLMFAAGGIIWRNVRPVFDEVGLLHLYGWPATMYVAIAPPKMPRPFYAPMQLHETSRPLFVKEDDFAFDEDPEARNFDPFVILRAQRIRNNLGYRLPHFMATGAAIDLAAALGILFAVWFICEWRIRRNEARKIKSVA